MINEQIRDKEVRVIGENGEQIGYYVGKGSYEDCVRKRNWIW